MDFQIREPVSPLLAGGLKKTNVLMEVQAAQEYTGQQIHAVSLTSQWETYLDFDTFAHGPGSTVGSVLSGTPRVRVTRSSKQLPVLKCLWPLFWE